MFLLVCISVIQDSKHYALEPKTTEQERKGETRLMRFEKKSENVIRSEVSQKEKDKCCILPQTYGI